MNRDRLHLSPSWFVLTVAPGKEREAVDVLSRRGFVAQRPVEAVWRRSGCGGKRKLVETPLTPRYVFHRCSGWPRFYDLSMIYDRNGSRLITGYLTLDGLPYPIPDQVVDALMTATTSGLMSIHRSIRPGDAIRVPALHDAVGRLIDAKGNLARVAIEMLGSLREMEIDINKVEAA